MDVGFRRIAGLAVAVGLAAAALVGCGSDDGDGPDEGSTAASAPPGADGPALAFGGCPALADGATRDPELTCGTVQVPLDYQDPGGRTIDVAVSKLATADPARRRGVLVLNPGGPALPGLDTPGAMAAELPPAVRQSYDLVGFDPRGVGHSTPQSCGIPDANAATLFPYPAADGSITADVERARATADRCAKGAPDLKFFTTANTARDLDRIRAALGEPKISYWGQSYGTYLGAVYEGLFPDRADRVVLEGNVDPTEVWAGAAASWGKGMAERFPDAARVAAGQDTELGLGRTAAEVTRNYLALADRLDRTPAPVPGTPLAVNGALLRSVTYGLLLENDRLPVLARFWKAVTDLADGAPTDADAAVLKQVFADGPVTPGVPTDNQATMFLALTCGDASWSGDVDDYARRAAADRAQYPLTAGMPVNIWPCAFWGKPVEAPVEVTDHGPRNTLILQNKRDNATPWDGGVGLHRVLGDRAGFVGVDNGGHYVYNRGSACADKATVDFLTAGDLPGDDVYCTDVKTG